MTDENSRSFRVPFPMAFHDVRLYARCRLFNAPHYGSGNLASNLTSTNLNLGSLGGSVSPTASNMSACMVQSASTGVPVASTGMTHHVTPHSPSEAKSGYPYLGGIDSQVCGRVHWINFVGDRIAYVQLRSRTLKRVSGSSGPFIVNVICAVSPFYSKFALLKHIKILIFGENWIHFEEIFPTSRRVDRARERSEKNIPLALTRATVCI